MCIPETPEAYIVLFLLLVNAILVLAYKQNCDYKDSEYKRLKDEKVKNNEPFTEKELREDISPLHWYAWTFGICICLDIWVAGALITHWWAGKFFIHVTDGDNNKALFGDSFGAVNALISAFAFAGMIVAFILQRYELRLQRKELEAQRKEFEEQNKTLRLQRFENLFYNMLNLQQTIVEGLRYEYYDEERVTIPLEKGFSTDKRFIQREVKGRDVFRYLFEYVQLPVEKVVGKNAVNGYRWFLYYKGLEEYDTTLVPTHFDHYFRHLYKIVQFVDKQQFEFEEKYKFISFLRGTLSRYELVWLYYNTLNPDFIKFKELIERYSLLKALRRDLLALSKETRTFYSSLGVLNEELENNNFNIGDFEFFLTDKSNVEGKYNVSAFWNSTDIEYGKNRLILWRAFVDKKAGAITEKG